MLNTQSIFTNTWFIHYRLIEQTSINVYFDLSCACNSDAKLQEPTNYSKPAINFTTEKVKRVKTAKKYYSTKLFKILIENAAIKSNKSIYAEH